MYTDEYIWAATATPAVVQRRNRRHHGRSRRSKIRAIASIAATEKNWGSNWGCPMSLTLGAPNANRKAPMVAGTRPIENATAQEKRRIRHS